MTMSQKLSWASGQWNFRRRSVTRTISVVMLGADGSRSRVRWIERGYVSGDGGRERESCEEAVMVGEARFATGDVIAFDLG